MAFITAFILRTRLSMLNKRNAMKLQEMSAEEKELEEGPAGEIPDTDPRYVFMT